MATPSTTPPPPQSNNPLSSPVPLDKAKEPDKAKPPESQPTAAGDLRGREVTAGPASSSAGSVAVPANAPTSTGLPTVPVTPKDRTVTALPDQPPASPALTVLKSPGGGTGTAGGSGQTELSEQRRLALNNRETGTLNRPGVSQSVLSSLASQIPADMARDISTPSLAGAQPLSASTVSVGRTEEAVKTTSAGSGGSAAAMSGKSSSDPLQALETLAQQVIDKPPSKMESLISHGVRLLTSAIVSEPTQNVAEQYKFNTTNLKALKTELERVKNQGVSDDFSELDKKIKILEIQYAIIKELKDIEKFKKEAAIPNEKLNPLLAELSLRRLELKGLVEFHNVFSNDKKSIEIPGDKIDSDFTAHKDLTEDKIQLLKFQRSNILKFLEEGHIPGGQAILTDTNVRDLSIILDRIQKQLGQKPINVIGFYKKILNARKEAAQVASVLPGLSSQSVASLLPSTPLDSRASPVATVTISIPVSALQDTPSSRVGEADTKYGSSIPPGYVGSGGSAAAAAKSKAKIPVIFPASPTIAELPVSRSNPVSDLVDMAKFFIMKKYSFGSKATNQKVYDTTKLQNALTKLENAEANVMFMDVLPKSRIGHKKEILDAQLALLTELQNLKNEIEHSTSLDEIDFTDITGELAHRYFELSGEIELFNAIEPELSRIPLIEIPKVYGLIFSQKIISEDIRQKGIPHLEKSIANLEDRQTTILNILEKGLVPGSKQVLNADQVKELKRILNDIDKKLKEHLIALADKKMNLSSTATDFAKEGIKKLKAEFQLDREVTPVTSELLRLTDERQKINSFLEDYQRHANYNDPKVLNRIKQLQWIAAEIDLSISVYQKQLLDHNLTNIQKKLTDHRDNLSNLKLSEKVRNSPDAIRLIETEIARIDAIKASEEQREIGLAGPRLNLILQIRRERANAIGLKASNFLLDPKAVSVQDALDILKQSFPANQPGIQPPNFEVIKNALTVAKETSKDPYKWERHEWTKLLKHPGEDEKVFEGFKNAINDMKTEIRHLKAQIDSLSETYDALDKYQKLGRHDYSTSEKIGYQKQAIKSEIDKLTISLAEKQIEKEAAFLKRMSDGIGARKVNAQNIEREIVGGGEHIGLEKHLADSQAELDRLRGINTPEKDRIQGIVNEDLARLNAKKNEKSKNEKELELLNKEFVKRHKDYQQIERPDKPFFGGIIGALQEVGKGKKDLEQAYNLVSGIRSDQSWSEIGERTVGGLKSAYQGLKQSVGQGGAAVANAAAKVYFAPRYTSPQELQLRHEMANAGYTWEKGFKQLDDLMKARGNQEALAYLQAEFRAWAFDHPETAQKIIANVCISLSFIGSERDYLNTLRAGVRARAIASATFGDLGRPMAPEPPIKESDFKFLALADFLTALPTAVSTAPELARGLFKALTGGEIGDVADNVLQAFQNNAQIQMTQSLVNDSNPDQLQSYDVMTSIASEDDASAITGEQTTLQSLRLVYGAAHAVIDRPKSVAQDIFDGFDNRWLATKKAFQNGREGKGWKEFIYRAVTNYALPAAAVALGLAAALNPVVAGLIAVGAVAALVIGIFSSYSGHNIINNQTPGNFTWATVQREKIFAFIKESHSEKLMEQSNKYITNLQAKGVIPKPYDMEAEWVKRSPGLKDWLNKPRDTGKTPASELRDLFVEKFEKEKAKKESELRAEYQRRGLPVDAQRGLLPLEIIQIYRNVLKDQSWKDKLSEFIAAAPTPNKSALKKLLESQALSPLFDPSSIILASINAGAPKLLSISNLITDGFREQWCTAILKYDSPQAWKKANERMEKLAQNKARDNYRDLDDPNKVISEARRQRYESDFDKSMQNAFERSNAGQAAARPVPPNSAIS